MRDDLEGKVVLVTGASRNIGKATALAAAERGADLVLCTRQRTDELEDVAEQAAALGAEVLAQGCDVTDPGDVERLVGSALETFGRVDVLVNNATVRVHQPFLELTREQWAQAIAVNLVGPFLLCQAVLPSMAARQWGRIINFSGNSAHRGGGATTATVKAGVVGLTRSLAKEFAKHHITANCVSPGSIRVQREPGTERPSDLSGEVSDAVPIRRFGTPEEVASLVVYLASEDAAYITGQCVAVNGGAHFL